MLLLKSTAITHLIGVITLLSLTLSAQDKKPDAISEQIKMERDHQLDSIRQDLKSHEEMIKKITNQLSTSENNNTSVRIVNLEKLHEALDGRTKALEEAPRINLRYNAYNAFRELLSVEDDVKVLQLVEAAKDFFSALNNISSLNQYDSFQNWKKAYEEWAKGQRKNNQIIEFLNSSLNLIGKISQRDPLYGPIVKTAASLLSTLIENIGKRNRLFEKETLEILKLLNATSQFDSQKVTIDHEWDEIRKDLEQLHVLDSVLLKNYLTYYGLYEKYNSDYLNTGTSKKDDFKIQGKDIIYTKITTDLEQSKLSIVEVQKYIYKVQSLSIRLGKILIRIKSNINKYEDLIKMYSNENIADDNVPLKEFTEKVQRLTKSLSVFKNSFLQQFNPERYLEEAEYSR